MSLPTLTRMEIRNLRSLDWPEVARIYEDGIRTGNATFETGVPSWESWDAAHSEHRLVAELDGRVAAFASVGPSSDPPDAGEVYAIYALPESWGTGAGPALLEAGVEALRAAGYPFAVLWVLDDNPRARRFYEREGWTLDGQERRGEHLGVETLEVRYRRGL